MNVRRGVKGLKIVGESCNFGAGKQIKVKDYGLDEDESPR